MLLSTKPSQGTIGTRAQKKQAISQLAHKPGAGFCKSADPPKQRRLRTQISQVEESILKKRSKGLESSVEQAVLHPDIYHRPEIRKQYFRQLVDSYFSRSYHPPTSPSRRKNRTRHITNLRDAESTNQLDFYSQKDNEENHQQSLTNSVQKIRSHKRIWTAGYSRHKDAKVDQSRIKVMTRIQKFTHLETSGTGSLMKRNPSIRLSKKGLRLNNQQNINQSNLRRGSGKEKYNATGQKSDILNINGNDFDNSSIVSDSNPSQTINQDMGAEFRKRIKTKKLQHLAKNHKLTSYQDFSSANSRTQKDQNVLLFPQSQGVDTDSLNDLTIQIVENAMNQCFRLSSGSWKVVSIHSNELSTIYYLNRTKFQAGRQTFNFKIKLFNQASESLKMMRINEKIKSFAVTRMWEPLPGNLKSFASQEVSVPFYSPDVPSLRHELFQFKRMQKVCDNKNPSFAVCKTHKYWQLFDSNCEQFKDIIIAVAKDLMAMKGTLINNRISLDNLYRMGEKQIKIGDWSNAAMNSKIVVAGKSISFRDEPVLAIKQMRSQSVGLKWLVSPEVLPPEIVKAIMRGQYNSIWELQNCAEVWSLGIVIFEILTCIPVDMPASCYVGHRLPKRGCFYDKQKRLSQILELEEKMPALISRWIRDERESDVFQKTDKQIINLMKQMLQVNANLRPSPEDIIKRLSKPNI